MSNILTIALKDLRVLWRDKFGVFWILAFPLIFALFFGFIFGGEGDGRGSISIAIVDLDQSDASREFITALTNSDAVSAATRDSGEPWTLDIAHDAVRTGRVTAYVVVPDGYGDDKLGMFMPDAPKLQVGIDPARSAERGMLEGVLMQASFERMQTMFSDPKSMQPDLREYSADIKSNPDIEPAQKAILTTFFGALDLFLGSVDTETMNAENAPSFQPMQLDIKEVQRDTARPANAFEITFPQAMVWGIIGCAAGFAITLVQEKTRGTWFRLVVAPQSRAAILAGKGLACFLACCIAIALLIVIGAVIFGVRIGSPLAILAIVSSALCFTGLMMLISTLGRTEQAVAGAGWAALMPLTMIGGGMVPLFVMPSWLQSVSSISPVKWSIVALEGAIWRGFTLTEMLLPCAILLAVGAVGYAIGVSILMRRTA